MTWTATGRLRSVLNNFYIPINIKAKELNFRILSVTTYGLETMSITDTGAHKLRTTQRAIERLTLGINLKDCEAIACTYSQTKLLVSYLAR